jgi:hypothetical protein
LSGRTGTKRDTYVVAHKKLDIIPYACGPWGIMGDDSKRTVLVDVVAGKLDLELTAWSEQPQPDGGPVVLVETLYRPTGVRNRSWLLPGAGFTCSRYEMVDDKSGAIRMEARAEAYEVTDGFQYPKRGKRLSYSGGRLESETAFDITFLTLRPGDIPDDLFDPAVPEGAAVFDADLGIYVRDPKLAQAHLDEVVKLAGGTSHLTYGHLVVGGLGAAALLLVGTIVWRRRSTVRAK